MKQAVSALIRKDVRLELRTRESVPAMVLFAIGTFVLFHFALDQREVSGGLAAGILWMTLLFGGNLAAALLTYRRAGPRGRLFREGVVLAVAMAGLAFAVCAFAQTPPDAARSLYAFHALCDLLLIADAAWLTRTLLAKVAPSPALQ